jgi:hypothetical protein
MSDIEDYEDCNGDPMNLSRLVRLEPDWAASRIREGRKDIETIKELEAQHQWISAQTPPEASERSTRSRSVLAWCPSNKCEYTAIYDHIKGHWEYFGGSDDQLNECVTHWQPLPPPPEA